MDIRNSRLIISIAIATTVIISIVSYWQIGQIRQRLPNLTEQPVSSVHPHQRLRRKSGRSMVAQKKEDSRRALSAALQASQSGLLETKAELKREQLKNQKLHTQLSELQNQFEALQSTSQENTTLLVDLVADLSEERSHEESQLPDMPLFNDETNALEDIELMQWQLDAANARVRDLEELILKEMTRSNEAVAALVLAGEAVVPQLTVLLESDDSDLQIWAANILGRMGMEAHDATEALIRMTRSGSPAARQAAQQALDSIDGQARLGLP